MADKTGWIAFISRDEKLPDNVPPFYTVHAGATGRDGAEKLARSVSLMPYYRGHKCTVHLVEMPVDGSNTLLIKDGRETG